MPTKSSRPNILFIVSDDHGYADRSALGQRDDVATPALDRLAAEGVSCTDAYVTAPICSPSRAGMITGRYQQRWGGLWFDSARFPNDDQPTLAETLHQQGYRTGYFGKVHYGPEQVGDRACPPHHGFDTTLYGLAGHSMGRLNYLHHSAQAQQEYGAAAVPMAVQPLMAGDDPVEFEGFLTDELARAAGEFIGEAPAGEGNGGGDDQPFFCMLSFNAVHNFCWQLPAEELERRGLPAYSDWDPDSGTPYGEWYDDAIVPNLPHGREYYLAQLELMDAAIGRILDLLNRTGRAADTLVVYTTDNGGSTCNYGDNAPLRGTKYTLWEGGIRVPMLWRWPGQLPAGAEHTDLVSTLDLHPTFGSAAGAAAGGGLDGIDLLSRLAGVQAHNPTDGDPADDDPAEVGRSLHWECGFQWAIREGDWKLAWTDPENPTVDKLRAQEHAPLGQGWHLADLAQDLGEQVNRYAAEPEVVARLVERHTAWRADIGLPPRPVPTS